MPNEHLATYLNDHLAGAVAAVKLLEHLETTHRDTPVSPFAAALRADIEADRRELEGLMARLDVSESGPRKATAWLAERVTQLKLRVDDKAGGTLRLLESLEAVSLGIEGKLTLWRTLAAGTQDLGELRGVDYDRLARRAEEQRARVEPIRLDAARAAFAATSGARAG